VWILVGYFNKNSRRAKLTIAGTVLEHDVFLQQFKKVEVKRLTMA
jgi:hypothetical protein